MRFRSEPVLHGRKSLHERAHVRLDPPHRLAGDRERIRGVRIFAHSSLERNQLVPDLSMLTRLVPVEQRKLPVGMSSKLVDSRRRIGW